MLRFKRIIIILSFLSIAGVLYTQNNTVVDSLLELIEGTDSDSLKMDTYNKLRRATYYNNAEDSRNYTLKYLEYARMRRDSHHIALAQFYLGNAFVMEGNYDKALSEYLLVADYFSAKQDSVRLASVFNSIGAVHEKTNNDSLSLVYYQYARSIGKSLGDYKRSGIASVNIGNIYNNQNKLDLAIQFLEGSVRDLSTHPSFKSFLIIAKINLAGAYHKSKSFEKSLKLYKEVLTQIDTTNDVYNHANILRGISNALLSQGEITESSVYAERAYTKYTQFNYIDEQYQMLPELIAIYKSAELPEKAIEYYEAYFRMQDSLFVIKQDENIADALQKYETEKKDAQLELMALKTERTQQQNKLYILLIIGVFLIAGIVSFFLYKNRKKNLLLDRQKKILEVAIDEKNTLLKETHHRVKNSFQIVSSLLYLQSENIEDNEAILALQEAQNRVRSMILIHQRLYNNDQIVGIDIKDYIQDLTNDFFESHQQNDEKITYKLDIEEIVLSIDTVTPLGLIINELYTNVVKHAFKNKAKDKRMEVKLKTKGPILLFEVEDNGSGMEADINEDSFGIILINALAKKLKGTLNYIDLNGKGTLAQLEIKSFKQL